MNYIEDDISFARWFENIHSDRKSIDLKGLQKRYWYNMNARVKTGSYKAKGIKVIWSFEEFIQWWNDNFKRYETILERGLTPSIDRIDSKKHYEASNCRWLPNNVNSALGKVEYLMVEMRNLQTFLKENEEWLK
jgi:hypothetical protein